MLIETKKQKGAYIQADHLLEDTKQFVKVLSTVQLYLASDPQQYYAGNECFLKIEIAFAPYKAIKTIHKLFSEHQIEPNWLDLFMPSKKYLEESELAIAQLENHDFYMQALELQSIKAEILRSRD